MESCKMVYCGHSNSSEVISWILNFDFGQLQSEKVNEIEDITWLRGDTKFLHKWAQWTSEIFFQHKKRNFVSPSGHVMFYLLYKHQWTTKPFHFNSFSRHERRDLLCSHSCNSDIFTREDNDYVLFSHVKADIKFPRKRSPDFSLV